ncbi:MAG: hypothetical protein ACNI27_15170 [Desulfovibrio sp.]
MRINFIFAGFLLLFSAYMHYTKYFDHWGVNVPEEGCYVLALGGFYFLLCGFNVIMKSNEEPEKTEHSADIEPESGSNPEKKE